MYYRYTILFCFLLIVAIGSDDRPGNVYAQRASEPTPRIDSVNTHYEQLLRDRLEIQEKIFAAMDLYREAAQKVREQEIELMRLLGDKPAGEAIDLFIAAVNIREIPMNLRQAYSLWLGIMPDETQQLFIDNWIITLLESGIFEEQDRNIRNLENRRQLGEIVTAEDLTRHDMIRARTRKVLEENLLEDAKNALLEDEVIENQRSRWTNRE